ncbi:hypothetical protein AB0E59_36305 [Lentzea sp. NPDC034063]|uniref:hypothetical protein n=1 Tax=unclassified Lentzea TaxID=2643253 RepID=UPI0033CCD9CD
MVAVDDALSRFLGEAGEGALTLFAASCVERGSGVFFLALAYDESRGGDVEEYARFLDDLWSGTSLSLRDRESHQGRIDSFPEMQGEEEPPGIMAFAYDAVAAMYYSYAYLVSGDSINVKYCSNHMLNSAGYIDDAVPGSSNRYEDEIAEQLGAVEALSSDLSKVEAAVLRERARAMGRDRVDALRIAFSE